MEKLHDLIQWLNHKNPHKSIIFNTSQEESKAVSSHFRPTQCFDGPQLKNENVPIKPHPIVQPNKLNHDSDSLFKTCKE